MSRRSVDKRFFASVSEHLPTASRQAALVVLTHVLGDRFEFLEALERFAPIRTIVAIPYSVDVRAFARLRRRWVVETPTLEELSTQAYVESVLTAVGHRSRDPIALVEIGGYFAETSARAEIVEALGIIGVVEDTEAGHLRYINATPVIPVISVARSPIKAAEDALVGASVCFSIEKVLRANGILFQGLRVGILGYGRVGHGLARDAQRRGAHVYVYDRDSVRRMRAASDGYLVPKRAALLAQSDVIVGATGNASINVEDLDLMQGLTILASASSRKAEFARLLGLAEGGDGRLQPLRHASSEVLLLDGGAPANFLDGAELGPSLRAVQAEIIAGVAQLLSQPDGPAGVSELKTETRRMIAGLWCDEYLP